MSRPKDLRNQISSLHSELELSTFLNKGILQANQEQKIRIVELERENAVLRVAESTLARTEDALEVAEKALRERDEERTDWEEEVNKEENEREKAEKERDMWKFRYEKMKDGWQVLQKGMNALLDEQPSKASSSVGHILWSFLLILLPTEYADGRDSLENRCR